MDVFHIAKAKQANIVWDQDGTTFNSPDIGVFRLLADR